MADGNAGPSPATRTGTRSRPSRDVVRLVAAGVIVVVLVAFVLDNSQSVKLGFVFASATVPLIWVLIATALVGAGLDRLVVWRRRQHRRRGTAA
ncbi:MAG: LapA family protein [Actinomycetota bacterium]|jgi:uncharacterized integral membrane protein|nr:LapA family protein [Actinomycetota bacterium]